VSARILADEFGAWLLLEVNSLVVQEVTCILLGVFIWVILLGVVVPTVLLVGRDIFASFLSVILIVIIKLIFFVLLAVGRVVALLVAAPGDLFILREFIVNQKVVIVMLLLKFA